jgi:tetratricopeptide (TPR) repeat protein
MKFEATLTIFTQAQDAVGIGKSLNGLSLLYLSRAEYGRSLAYSQAAAAILQEAGSPTDYALAVYQLAQSHLHLGQFAKAEQQLEAALGLYHAQGDREGEDRVLLHLGQLYAVQSKYLFALACYEAVLDSVINAPLREEGPEILQDVLAAMMHLCRQQAKTGKAAIARFQQVLEPRLAVAPRQRVNRLVQQLVQGQELLQA